MDGSFSFCSRALLATPQPLAERGKGVDYSGDHGVTRAAPMRFAGHRRRGYMKKLSVS